MSSKYLNCELLYEDSVNNMNRVVLLEDGSLFTLGVIKKNIYNIGNYPMRQYIFSRRSYNGGKTWTIPKTLFEFTDTRMFNDLAQFMISNDGYLHIFAYRIWKYDFKTNEFNGDILHIRMDDTNGTNPDMQKVECLDRYTGSLNNLIQLESGRIVVPFSTLDEETGTFQSSTIYSDDEGITWNVSNQLTVRSEETHVESGAVEPVIAEVETNKLVMLIRTVLGSFYYSISTDGGKSWCETKASNIKSSNAPAVLQKLKDGRILVSWNNCNGMPMRGVRYSMARQCLHAAISDDGLKTLKGVRMIVKKEAEDPDDVLNCYPFTSLTEDDEVFMRLMTIQSKDGEKWPEPNVKLIRLGARFLYETEAIGNPKDWINEGSLCLEPNRDKPGYAAINFPYGQKGALELSYDSKNATVQLILSDNYIDVSNFILDEDNEKYRKYIDENYIGIPFKPKDGQDKLKITWDDNITLEHDGNETNCVNNFSGFNHMAVLVTNGQLTIKDFDEKSEKAWLDTGIKY